MLDYFVLICAVLINICLSYDALPCLGFWRWPSCHLVLKERYRPWNMFRVGISIGERSSTVPPHSNKELFVRVQLWTSGNSNSLQPSHSRIYIHDRYIYILELKPSHSRIDKWPVYLPNRVNQIFTVYIDVFSFVFRRNHSFHQKKVSSWSVMSQWKIGCAQRYHRPKEKIARWALRTVISLLSDFICPFCI